MKLLKKLIALILFVSGPSSFSLFFVGHLATIAWVITIALLLLDFPRISGWFRKYSTAKKRIACILAMSDEEFDCCFSTIPAPPVAPPPSRPTAADFQRHGPVSEVSQMTDARAYELAKTWWEQPGSDGSSGEEKIANLIEGMSYENPTKRTAVLSDYAEKFGLPCNETVRSKLVHVLKSNGIGAEIAEDGTFFIEWGQDCYGREAGAI